MTPNKLRPLLGPAHEAIKTSNEYWSSLQIDNAYILVITGRCGSTLLTRLLSSLSLFGKPDELFTEEFLPYMIDKYKCSSISSLLPCIVKDNSSNRSFGFQIDPLRLSWLSDYWDIASSVGDSSLKFGAIIRYDLLSQAYSYLASKKSGIWHRYSHSADPGEYSTDSVLDITDTGVIASISKELLVELYLILKSEEAINQLARMTSIRPVMITYEELISDRFHAIYKLMRGLGADDSVICGLVGKRESLDLNPTIKNTYTHKEAIFDYLYKTNRELLLNLNTERSALLEEVRATIHSK